MDLKNQIQKRTIKFRAWWKKQLRYNAIAGNGQCLFIPNGTGEYKWVNMAECNVMEFSGLQDIKGKDIYEDDLLGYWKKDVNKKDKLLLCRVSFRNGAFVADVSKNLDGKLFTDLSSYLDKYIVIGNIYENADLFERSLKADA